MKNEGNVIKIKGFDFWDDVVTEIGKFAILWNEFERKHTTFGKIKIRDIESANLPHLSPEDTRKIRDALKFQYEEYHAIERTPEEIKRFLKAFLYTEHGRFIEKDFTLIRKFYEDNGTEDEITKGCLLTIHRYRDNLLHGIKTMHDDAPSMNTVAWGLNGQLDIFIVLNSILESIE